MIRDNTKIKGRIKFELFDKDGKLVAEREIKNLVTALMDAHMADQMSDQTDIAIGYIAIGSGTGQSTSSTGLATSLARLALTSTTQGSGGSDNDVVYVGSFGAGVGTGTVSEAGIMRLDDDASLMTYSSAFTPIVKAAGDTLAITWTVTFGAS